MFKSGSDPKNFQWGQLSIDQKSANQKETTETDTK